MRQLRVGVIGERGSGKDTVGDYLAQHYNCRKISIATPIKAIVVAAFEAAGIETSDKGSLRAPLQEAGLAGRRVDNDLWVRSLVDRHELEELHQGTGFVVTDIRYPNEAAILRSCGFILLRVEASAELRRARSLARGDGSWKDEDSLHVSEVEQRTIVADHLIANDTDDKTNLYAAIETILAPYVYPTAANF